MSKQVQKVTPHILKLNLPIASSVSNSHYENPSYTDLDPRVKTIQLSNPKSNLAPSKQASAVTNNKADVSTKEPSANVTPSKTFTKKKSPNKSISQTTSPVKAINLSGKKSQVDQDQPLSPIPIAKKNSVCVSEPESVKANAEPTAEEGRERLFKIFQYYTSMVEHSNVIYLKAHRFTKMMIDSEVRCEELNQSSLDLLYAGELRRSGNLDFEKFLKLLARIAKVKYGQLSVTAAQDTTINEDSNESKESLQRLLKEHMFPLYVKIFKGACAPEDDSVSEVSIERNTNQVLGMVGDNLEEIYKKYFPFEIQSINDPNARRQKLENALFTFLRDLSVCPDLMSKGTAYAIWQEVLKSDAPEGDATNALDHNTTKMSTKSKGGKAGKNVAIPLTFEKFKVFIVRLASHGYKEQESVMLQSQRSQNYSNVNTPMGMGFFHQSFSLAQTPANLANQVNQGGFGTAAHQMSHLGTPAHQMSHFGTPANHHNAVSRFIGAQNGQGTHRSNMSINGGNGGGLPRTFSQQSGFFTQGLATGQSILNHTMTGEYKITQTEKTVLFLERMDTALRVLNPEKKNNVVGGGKSSRLITQSAMTKISHYLVHGEDGKGLDAHIKQKKVAMNTGLNYDAYNIDPEVAKLFEEFNQNLHKIFQHYASYSQPLNTTRLHAFKFHKLLREAGLSQALREASITDINSFKILNDVPLTPLSAGKNLPAHDADIIIAFLTGPKQVREINNKKINYDTSIESPFIGQFNTLYKSSPIDFATQGRLEFEAFLKAIEMISAKLYPDLELSKAVTRILEKNILKLEKEIDQIQKEQGSKPLKMLVDMLQDTEVVEFLAVTHKATMLYYRFYADKNGMMNIEKFMQFCKDFEIFPSLISKSRLCNLFRALSGVRAQAQESDAILNFLDNNEDGQEPEKKKKEKEKDDEAMIDEHMFVEALAVCAYEIPYLNPQPNDVLKIFNFLEKINHSKGPQIVRRELGTTRAIGSMSWDIMYEIRNKYPELFIEEEEPLTDKEAEKVIQEKLKAGK